MKAKSVMTGILPALMILLPGCQTVSVEQIKTSASQATINQAKRAIEPLQHFSVLENGVIYYSRRLPPNSKWSMVKVAEISYRIPCQDLRRFIDQGMIVRMQYKGAGGRTSDYDKKRCEADVPTDLYQDVEDHISIPLQNLTYRERY